MADPPAQLGPKTSQDGLRRMLGIAKYRAVKRSGYARLA